MPVTNHSTPSLSAAPAATGRDRNVEVLVLTHTHWDREWYRSAEEFRLALVDLVDEVLDGRGGAHFLLDGQAIVLDDYLAVRPKRREEVVRALRDGALEAGPWYVLGDTLIPGGEALVRNLLAGRAALRALGAAPPPVLYCPDSFGHAAALPLLAAGFGSPLIVLWRGYGGARWPAGDGARWRAHDGTEGLVYHLPPDGYEFGASLPADADDAAARWERLRDTLLPRSALGVLLVLNGADHHAPQERLDDALASLARAAAPLPVRATSLVGAAEELLARAAARALPVVTGELRDSTGYTWSLQGTFGTRPAQKRANAGAERLLVRGVEPWAALARWKGAPSRRDEVAALWRALLECHPHDTLCGCSVDAVAASMDARLAAVQRGATFAAERAVLGALGHDAVAAREAPGRWRHVVVVRNGAARPRAGVAELVVDLPLADVPVGPGSAGVVHAHAAPAHLAVGDPAIPLQLVARERAFSRVESPRHYPHNSLVERRRYLAWVPPVAPLSLAVLPLRDESRERPTAPTAARVSRGVVHNEHLRLSVRDGGVLLEDADGRSFADIVGFEDEGERGDLYTHSTVPGTLTRGRLVSHHVSAQGPLRAELTTVWAVPVVARTVTTATGAEVQHPPSTIRVTIRAQLDAAARLARLAITGDNRADDHRLRLVVRSGITRPAVWCDVAFGDIRRPTSGDVPAGDSREAAVAASPLHRSVSCFAAGHGLSLLSDGLAEHEVRDDGSIAVTLVRATGELSRHDLPERPGHAGWPAATPAAQMRGEFVATFALFPHGGRTDDVRVAIERCREDFLLPLSGTSLRSSLGAAGDPPSLELEGEGLAFSACKESDDGTALVLRCRNLLDRSVDGAWRIAGLTEARLARLDETPLGELPTSDDRVRFRAEPNAVVTILVRGGMPVRPAMPNA